MIITKLFEVRDAGTFIPVIASQLACDSDLDMTHTTTAEHYLLRRAGYGEEKLVLLTHLHGGHRAYCDMYDWNSRTMQEAHSYIQTHFSTLQTGEVIDVQFILGETKVCKLSESVHDEND